MAVPVKIISIGGEIEAGGLFDCSTLRLSTLQLSTLPL
jgi:hypothetical protein